jgi:hypothetical protein
MRFSGRGLLTALLTVPMLLVPAVAQAGTLDQSQTDTTDCSTDIGTTTAGAQSFKAGLTGNLDEIDVYFGLFPQGGGAAVTVQVQNAIAGMGGDIPGGTVLGTETLATPVLGWNQVLFSPTVPVTAGTKYAIVLSASAEVGAWSGSDFVDRHAPKRKGRSYRIQAVDRSGSTSWLGPVLRVRG